MQAFSTLFGVEDPQEVPFSGRTDRGIARDLFRMHGVEDSTENWHRLRSEYLRLLLMYLPQRQGKVLPGIRRLLDELTSRADVAIGLLTGNARDGARLKLEHYRLHHHFHFGGFGDQHVNRDDVARDAYAASREHVGQEVSLDDVWVIGDTPMDVQCARAIGARVAAVATGWHSRERLEATAPDLLLDDFEQADAFLQQLG